MTRLDGERAYIRSLTVDDTPELHALRVRNRGFFEPYEPVLTDADYSRSTVRATIEIGLREEAEDKSYTFGICRVGDGALVGRIRLSNVFRGPWHNANLGYYVDEANNGHGYATEAVRLTTTFAFRHAKLHRVQAAVLTDNPRSRRVLEKCGYRHEGLALRYLQIAGVWRDHDIFAVTSEEWPPA